MPLQLVLTSLLFIGVQTATPLPPQSAADQIASAVLAAPEDRRGAATVLGYDTQGKVVELRKGSNDLVCLADKPGDARFSVACYHRDLEPFMARGRELESQGIMGNDRNEKYRWKEIREGTLKMSKEPRMLYVLNGKGYDGSTGTVTGGSMRWVLYWPFATPESTGLPTKARRGEPWLMDAGTAGAHVMITPPSN
jgi:hypothetical protein